MITIDLQEIRANREKKEQKAKPVIILPHQEREAGEIIDKDTADNLIEAHNATKVQVQLKDALINDLDIQERELRIERAKMSNEYHAMIESGASQGEFAANYQKIESVSSQIREVYDARDHVYRFGRLPGMGSAQSSMSTSDLLALKDLRRSLINRRCKIKDKLEIGKAKNPNRLANWKLELDKLDTEYFVVQQKINELRNGQ
jgi:hypothetical protein